VRQRPEPRPRFRLVVVALIALASLGALAVSRPPLPGSVWSRGDDLALAVAWLVAVAASAWLFVASGACVLALGLTRPALAQRFARALPFGLRRLVEIAIVTSCVALPALPARAAGPAPVAAVVVHDQPVVRASGPPATTAPAPAPVPRTIPPPSEPAPSPLPSRLVVRSGDNLWLIARTSLAQASGRRPDVAEIARYWREVIDANRGTLRCGDPSVIFPGEIVTLPAPPAVS
jgi:nucleoid-associated protein YgaU